MPERSSDPSKTWEKDAGLTGEMTAQDELYDEFGNYSAF